MQLQPLGRLAAIARRPAAAVHLTQDVFRYRKVVLDFDLLEHRLGEAEFLGHEIDDFEIVF